MKKLLLLGAIALSINVFGQNVNIPDANFKAYLLGEPSINTNGDGEIQDREAYNFKGIMHLRETGISDLKGIEAFTALKGLDCSKNKITILNVTKNTALIGLKCKGNQLRSLDVTKNTGLRELHCGGNQLTSLNLKKNKVLSNFYCQNNQLTYLDLKNNTGLTILSCSNNQLTSLDLKNNTVLVKFYCDGNKLNCINDLPTDCELTGSIRCK